MPRAASRRSRPGSRWTERTRRPPLRLEIDWHGDSDRARPRERAGAGDAGCASAGDPGRREEVLQPPARRAASLAARQGATARSASDPFQRSEYHIRDTRGTAPCRRTSGCPGGTSGTPRDARVFEAFERAITIAIDRTRAEAKDARVLNLGCGADSDGVPRCPRARTASSPPTGGCTTRWRRRTYSTTASATTRPPSVYKRPTDLAMLRDVPVSCNVCGARRLEDGLLLHRPTCRASAARTTGS